MNQRYKARAFSHFPARVFRFARAIAHVTNYIGYVSTAAGQYFTADDGHQWHFDAGSLALDFAYTGAMGDNPAWERLNTPADLALWLDQRFPEVDGTATDRDLTDALALRRAIASAAIAISRGDRPTADDIDVINLFAATPDIPPALRLKSGNAPRRQS